MEKRKNFCPPIIFARAEPRVVKSKYSVSQKQNEFNNKIYSILLTFIIQVRERGVFFRPAPAFLINLVPAAT